MTSLSVSIMLHEDCRTSPETLAQTLDQLRDVGQFTRFLTEHTDTLGLVLGQMPSARVALVLALACVRSFAAGEDASTLVSD